MIKIRLMERRDIPACTELAAIGFGPLFGSLAHVDFNEAFGSAAWRPTFYIAEDSDIIAGMGAYNIAWLGYGIYSLTWLVVSPRYRRQGIASGLVDRRLKDLRPIARLILTETPSDDVATLYERRGFKRILTISGERDRESIPEVLLSWTSAINNNG